MKNNMRPVHPGRHVRMMLEEFGLSNAATARILSVTPARIGGILRGYRNLSVEMCYRLAGIGSTPSHWMALQDQYDMKIAERDQKPLKLKTEVSRRFKGYRKEHPAHA